MRSDESEEGIGRIFCRRPGKKPGFPLQVLGFAYAKPAGFPLQSLARPGSFKIGI
jgi:hypothetical protein